MRAITLHEFGSPKVLTLEELPDPEPSPGEVRIRVLAAGLNPLDYKMRDGSSGMCSRMSLPTGLGRELCGVVEALGDGVPDTPLPSADGSVPDTATLIGSTVFGMRRPSDTRGCYADEAVIALDELAAVPAGGDPLTYGGLALAGLTALTAVEDQARIREGETVLVHGGSGGVGQIIVALARAAGARVLATCSAANIDRVRSLGAEPFDYTGTGQDAWPAAVLRATDGNGINAVIDTHYFSTFVPSLDVLAPAGRIVVLPTLADTTPATARGIEVHVPSVAPHRARLQRLTELVTDGTLSVEVSEVFPLDEVARAHALLETGHTRGKIILRP
ncbi:NADP-dependent oxidoreductase [Devriesea agamarum]|uniref:NADP-dependent oxidoreductase n=1 Tax=Devriesea agamarum TaxID=472569 RepID=UPI00071E17D3|nr:NADP-dependent oxidoreductase [Devriesea agamarum]